ncbi:MAG: hypothetical protein H3C34_16050 [Caldilineaceae bacterium]|nr:hypothetical protein [Caldilineaceae bacterium]
MDPLHFTAPQQPAQNADGSITALVATPARQLAGATHITLTLPAGLPADRLAGRYMLARCGVQSEWERTHNWHLYLRRPLFVAGHRQTPGEQSTQEEWRFCLPFAGDPGYAWLAAQPPGTAVNLIGPLGNGFVLPDHARHLLVAAEPARLPALLPLIDDMLDRGGQVTIAIRSTTSVPASLLSALPVAVEIRHAATDEEWAALLEATLLWADQLAGWLPWPHLPSLAAQIRNIRMRLEKGFAHCLVDSDLACGYGACLACAVPLAQGKVTRACVHGPVFDLRDLVG